MIRPMPFCPSFDPWAKLTPVHVSTSRARIQNGGGASPSGALYSRGSWMNTFDSCSSRAATANPMIGENISDLPIFSAWSQSTPLVAVRAFISWFAMPTPMIEPISVCELDAGSPSHHVPRFQMMAADSNANTIAYPAPLPTCRINSTGSSDTMAKATAPVDKHYAQEVPESRPRHRHVRIERMGVDHRRHCVGRVVETVDELKSQGDQQRDAQQQESSSWTDDARG